MRFLVNVILPSCSSELIGRKVVPMKTVHSTVCGLTNHCFWKNMLLFSVLKVISQRSEDHSQNDIHLQFTTGQTKHLNGETP